MATIGDKFVETGLKVYDRFVDRKQLPTNKRVFLESVLDKSKDPITENTLSPSEMKALSSLIARKYERIAPHVQSYKEYLKKALIADVKAVKAKNKDAQLYDDFRKRYMEDLDAINQFEQGKLTPTFVKIASGELDYPRSIGLRESSVGTKVFNVSPNVQYEDYPVDIEETRSTSAGDDPYASIATLLGRFNYSATPEGHLEITDKYDFNPARSTITGSTVTNSGVGLEQVGFGPEGGGKGIYGLLRHYAGNVMPEGAGRDVRIRLNSLAPAPVNQLLSR